METATVEPTPTAEEPAHLLYATPPLSTHAPTALHSGMTVPRFFAMHSLGAVFPVTAGAMIFGWRAVGVMLMVLITSIGAAAVWKRIGRRGAGINYSHVIWLATLLA